jgi:arsenite methyltransferase
MKKYKIISIVLFLFAISNIFCDPYLAKRFNQSAKEKESKPDEIIAIIKSKITSEKTIVDLGAGGGYFTLRFAQEVVPNGIVYAVDINQEYLDYIKQLAQKENINNIKYILATEEDSKLPNNTADLIFVRNVFHHINNPEKYFTQLKTKLKPEGLVVIIDYLPEHAPITGFLLHHKHGTEPAKILSVMEKAGYKLFEKHEFLPKQSFFIFR